MGNHEVRIRVSNFARNCAFYETVLKPTGIDTLHKLEDDSAVSFGYNGITGWLMGGACLVLVDSKTSLLVNMTKPSAGGKWEDEDQERLLDSEEQELGESQKLPISQGVHIRLPAPNRMAVDAFFQAATAAGAKGILQAHCRPNYGKHFYNAVIQDADGRTLELICDSHSVLAGKYGIWVRGLLVLLYFVVVTLLLNLIFKL